MTEHQAEPAVDLSRQAHERGLWAMLTCVAIGLWLIGSPASLGYVWTDMGWSEWGAGAATVVLGVLAISPRWVWPAWGLCGVGIWLLFAPLLLWADAAAAYVNSTFSGILLIGLSVVIPRRQWAQPVQPSVPAGWSFNPSSWVQRVPIVALAWLCFVISRYMTGYQLGYTDQAWDPVFGEGTQRVLDSDVARAWPVSDAGLGAAAYALEALVGCMGGTSRWRTAPWVVALFGVLVVPAGVVSIVLIILQPVVVGDWCSPCLVAAVAMLIMACLALPEVAAMVQYLLQCRRAGRSLWQVFWCGGAATEGATDEARPVSLTDGVGSVWRGMVEGASLSWGLVASLLLGVWVMLAPPVLGLTGAAADSHFLTGWLIVTVTALAVAEVARPVRWVNLLLAGWLIASPWVLPGMTEAGQWNAVAAGVALIVVSVPRGRIAQRHGRW